MLRLLIATGAVSPNPADLPAGVRLLLDAAEEILVAAPSLPTRIDWITSDSRPGETAGRPAASRRARAA
jgi:hypothetical protein